MTETILFEISDLPHWDLFGIWCLGFGASFVVIEQELDRHQPDADGDSGIRDIERWPMIRRNIKIKEIHHVAMT